jgi:hypothetical protein
MDAWLAGAAHAPRQAQRKTVQGADSGKHTRRRMPGTRRRADSMRAPVLGVWWQTRSSELTHQAQQEAAVANHRRPEPTPNHSCVRWQCVWPTTQQQGWAAAYKLPTLGGQRKQRRVCGGRAGGRAHDSVATPRPPHTLRACPPPKHTQHTHTHDDDTNTPGVAWHGRHTRAPVRAVCAKTDEQTQTLAARGRDTHAGQPSSECQSLRGAVQHTTAGRACAPPTTPRGSCSAQLGCVRHAHIHVHTQFNTHDTRALVWPTPALNSGHNAARLHAQGHNHTRGPSADEPGRLATQAWPCVHQPGSTCQDTRIPNASSPRSDLAGPASIGSKTTHGQAWHTRTETHCMHAPDAQAHTAAGGGGAADLVRNSNMRVTQGTCAHAQPCMRPQLRPASVRRWQTRGMRTQRRRMPAPQPCCVWRRLTAGHAWQTRCQRSLHSHSLPSLARVASSRTCTPAARAERAAPTTLPLCHANNDACAC